MALKIIQWKHVEVVDVFPVTVQEIPLVQR